MLAVLRHPGGDILFLDLLLALHFEPDDAGIAVGAVGALVGEVDELGLLPAIPVVAILVLAVDFLEAVAVLLLGEGDLHLLEVPALVVGHIIYSN